LHKDGEGDIIFRFSGKKMRIGKSLKRRLHWRFPIESQTCLGPSANLTNRIDPIYHPRNQGKHGTVASSTCRVIKWCLSTTK